MNSSYYKNCIVPQCDNTTIKTPNKIFIYVPNNAAIRRKWLKLARRNDADRLSTDSRMYFCEDHFDLPNDMLNYMEYHIMGRVSQVRMKPDCIPRKFDCQADRRNHSDGIVEETYALKKQRLMKMSECYNESLESCTSTSSYNDINSVKRKKCSNYVNIEQDSNLHSNNLMEHYAGLNSIQNEFNNRQTPTYEVEIKQEPMVLPQSSVYIKTETVDSQYEASRYNTPVKQEFIYEVPVEFPVSSVFVKTEAVDSTYQGES